MRRGLNSHKGGEIMMSGITDVSFLPSKLFEGRSEGSQFWKILCIAEERDG